MFIPVALSQDTFKNIFKYDFSYLVIFNPFNFFLLLVY